MGLQKQLHINGSMKILHKGHARRGLVGLWSLSEHASPPLEEKKLFLQLY